jgi:3-oxoacyl-[acyl-carrier protein] reductase
MDLGLTNATAVVVGGGRGMGLAAARCLADDGARVAIVARSRADLDRAAADLTDRGSPDAGRQLRRPGRRAVAAGFRRRRGGHGALRAFGSSATSEGGVGADRQLFRALHPASKRHTAGVHRGQSGADEYLQNLSLLLATDEILVNVVSPGSIASESLVGWAKSVGVDGDDPYRLMDAIAKHFGHPAHLPRAGLPDEMGSVVAFLASRRNSYMTGANINVDGGSDFT